MIEVLARSTNNAEPFCGQRKEGKFKCENFTAFFPGLHEIFDLHRTNFSSFVVCFHVVQLILFWKNNKISSLCQNLPRNKTASLVKMQMARNQPKTFQKRIFPELNNVTLAELPPKLRQTLVLTCSLRVESLHTLFAVAVGLPLMLKKWRKS